MRKLMLVGLLAVSGVAQAQLLYSNGPVVNGSGLSILQNPPNTTLGLGIQISAGNAAADDFVVTGPGWNVQSLALYSYQTGATAFSFTSASWSIVAGDVNNGTIVSSGTLAPTDGGLMGYRVTPSTLSNTQRPIFQLNLDIPDVQLAAGNYWLRWSVAGTLASGPWQPLTADSAVGNLHQSLTGGSFVQWADAGSFQGAEAPFAIFGSAVPEPGSYAMMGLGLLAIGGWARRRRG